MSPVLENNNFNKFGKGDWQFSTKWNSRPITFVLSVNDRNKITEDVCKLYCKWVLINKIKQVSYGADSQLDPSGIVGIYEYSKEELLQKYKNLGLWMYDASTEISARTFEANHGSHQERYEEIVDHIIRERKYAFVFDKFSINERHLIIDWFCHEAYDTAFVDWFDGDIITELMELISKVTTTDAWVCYGEITENESKHPKMQAAQNAQPNSGMIDLYKKHSAKFVVNNFPEILNTRLDLPHWVNSILQNTFLRKLKNAPIKQVVSIAAIGLFPCALSNAVSNDVRQAAHKILDERRTTDKPINWEKISEKDRCRLDNLNLSETLETTSEMMPAVGQVVSGFDELIDELKSHCYSSAILLLSTEKPSMKFDMHRNAKDVVLFGDSTIIDIAIKSRLLKEIADAKVAGIILRSFLVEIGTRENRMIDLRGYTVSYQNGNISFSRLPSESFKESCAFDPKTGVYIGLEEDANYL